MPILIFLIFQVEVKTHLLPESAHKKLTVGDPFELVVTLIYPQSGKISEPIPESLPPFAVLGLSNKVVQQKGTATSDYRIKLAAFAAGDLKLPVFKFVYQGVNAPAETLKSEPVPVTIASVLPKDMKDINDVKKMYEFPNYLPLVLLLIFLAALAAAYLGYRLYYKLRKDRALTLPALPPWEEALLALEKLNALNLVAQGFVKRYYYALSEILKRYIERRFAFNAVEQTTTEIMNHMKLYKIPRRDDFGKFFNRADMVKYAKLVPQAEELNTATVQVRFLVLASKPEEKSAEPE
jgi:hypothetical protein